MAPSCATRSTSGCAPRSTAWKTDPDRAAEVGRAIRNVVAHETVQAWLWDIWARMRIALEADAGKPNGHTIAFIEGALTNLGTLIEDRPGGARAAAIRRGGESSSACCPPPRPRCQASSATWLSSWDAATIVDRLELRVGRDLQYVRVNGTLVGFLVGGLVYALLRAMMGHVSF